MIGRYSEHDIEQIYVNAAILFLGPRDRALFGTCGAHLGDPEELKRF